MLIARSLYLLAIIMGLSGCDGSGSFTLPGYTYGEFTYLSRPFTDKVEQLFVAKGESVKKGQKLAQMETFLAENALRVAEENVQAERALLRNLQRGERPEGIEMIEAQLERAKSAASVAKSQLDRKKRLYSEKMISVAAWEATKGEYAQKNAQVKELQHQMALKRLPARQAEITHQRSRVQAATLQRDKAAWELQQRLLTAPLDGVVYDILYQPGEMPAAGKPIISLLAPENIKVRFYVPQKRLGEIRHGTRVNIICDGCKRALSGHVRYISQQAEFSPPVIYSTRRREKLLFMAEAVPVKADAPFLKTGQPVNVELVADE